MHTHTNQCEDANSLFPKKNLWVRQSASLCSSHSTFPVVSARQTKNELSAVVFVVLIHLRLPYIFKGTLSGFHSCSWLKFARIQQNDHKSCAAMIIHSACNEKHQQSINKQRLQARGQPPPDRNFQHAIYSAARSRAVVRSCNQTTRRQERFVGLVRTHLISPSLHLSTRFQYPCCWEVMC